MWHIGEDIPFVPNKRRGGVVLGGLIAPIFFNTTEDSGGLPIQKVDLAGVKTGDTVVLDLRGRRDALRDRAPSYRRFEFKPETIRDEFRAGGRLNLIIGRQLTDRARKALGLGASGYLRQGRKPGAEARPGLFPGPEDRGQGLRHRPASFPAPPASRR